MEKKTKKAIKKAAKKPAKPKVTPHPTAGPRIIDFERKLQGSIQDDGGIPPDRKRGRGRPPKQLEPEPATIPNVIVKQAIQVPFDLWAISQNLDELKLTDQEARLLADPVKALLDYYAPKVPVIVIAWLSLVVASYSVMRPRLELIAELKKQNHPSSESAGMDGQGQGGPAPPISAADRAPGQFPGKIQTKKI